MKLCAGCRRTPWPYLIVVFIAALSAFLTWLTLSSVSISPDENRWWTAGAFLGVSGLLGTYVLLCMRWHCSHGHALHDIQLSKGA